MSQTKTTRRREGDGARERAAALRAAQAQRERRRRLMVILGSVLGVLAVVAVIVVVGVNSGGGSAKDTGSPDRTVAPATVVSAVTGVTGATIDAVGKGAVSDTLKTVKDQALTSGGKPYVFYVGAEFCPYCAGSRWALVQALSRFGTFQGLGLTTSSSTDVYPGTPSFTFHGASYTSDVIAFKGRELQTRTGAPLESIPANESKIWRSYTGQGSFPFLDIAGHYVEIGRSVDPAVLQGLSASDIAARLAKPSDPVTQQIVGAANTLTAAICKVTDNQPSSVCSAAGVVTAGKALSG